MSFKLSMLTAVAMGCIPVAAGAQANYGSAAPKAEAQTDAQEGMTPAQAASKRNSKKAAPAAPSASAAQPPVAPQTTAPGQTGNTPGQAQTTPGQASELTPAVTGQTPSGQTTAQGQADASADTGALKPATKADMKAGAVVSDAKGGTVGKIESVDSDGALLDTGKVKAKIGLKSFMRSDKGLVIGMSRSELEAAAKAKQ